VHGASALASELAQVQAMVRKVEARMDQDLSAAARELYGELASSVDRSICIARATIVDFSVDGIVLSYCCWEEFGED
jgi:hypothetical protein